MNADEIVRELRAEAQFQKDRFSRFLLADAMTNAADLIGSLQAQLTASRCREKAARNELCLKCGLYHDAHNGACDGCRWKE